MNVELLQHSLIVSCQAPADSPLHDPVVIAAMAEAAVKQGAKGVRIDTPAHVKAVRRRLPDTPIIGLWKQQIPGCEVYITPRFADAAAIAEAGADIIALDGTLRDRPNKEILHHIIPRVRNELGKLVMADADSLEGAKEAVRVGADFVGTTLYGYTQATQNLSPPGWKLLSQCVEQLEVPIICEGGIASPEMAQKALQLGAYAVVVGAAITGIDLKVKAFLEQM
ncbi:MAG: N-acetylmannosamine-6-phosphate 2-epimerase [Cyanobacteriota bacterium]|nr:N-acetylmannosamine-6-phosphate 2-epimerase [Cyanobacteriota bacterium]